MQKYENREIMERSIKLFLIEYFSIQYFWILFNTIEYFSTSTSLESLFGMIMVIPIGAWSGLTSTKLLSVIWRISSKEDKSVKLNIVIVEERNDGDHWQEVNWDDS
jgi:hypothetical protein